MSSSPTASNCPYPDWEAATRRFVALLDEERTALGDAWAEAEAALPEGWWIHALYAWSFDDMAYRAEAASPGRQVDMSHSASTKRHGTKNWVTGPSATAYGPTPAAALRALALLLTPAGGSIR